MRENCYREIETHEIEIKNRNSFCNKNKYTPLENLHIKNSLNTGI